MRATHPQFSDATLRKLWEEAELTTQVILRKFKALLEKEEKGLAENEKEEKKYVGGSVRELYKSYVEVGKRNVTNLRTAITFIKGLNVPVVSGKQIKKLLPDVVVIDYYNQIDLFFEKIDEIVGLRSKFRELIDSPKKLASADKDDVVRLPDVAATDAEKKLAWEFVVGRYVDLEPLFYDAVADQGEDVYVMADALLEVGKLNVNHLWAAPENAKGKKFFNHYVLRGIDFHNWKGIDFEPDSEGHRREDLIKSGIDAAAAKKRLRQTYILAFNQDGGQVAWWSAKLTLEEYKLMKAEVRTYDKWIQKLGNGLAPASSYVNPEYKETLLAVKKWIKSGGDGPEPDATRGYYEKLTENFSVYLENPSKERTSERTSDRELRELLTNPWRCGEEFNMGYKILPVTQLFFR
jgi:hypothetical protein